MFIIPPATGTIRGAKLDIDIQRLRKSLDYDPSSGLLTWKRNYKKGRRAGRVDSNGYVSVFYDGMTIAGHRLAWAIFYGFVPNCEIDHINRIKTDNRICNLRLASRVENCRNTVSQKRSAGVVGTTPIIRPGRATRWQAQISVKGKNTYLGRFDTQEEASAAYQRARERQ